METRLGHLISWRRDRQSKLSYTGAHSWLMAALAQLFSFLLCSTWAAAAEFPAGPGWEWVSSMPEMGAQQFADVAEPLIKMHRNCRNFPKTVPIEGWALSRKVDPLWQAEGEGPPWALVYEELGVKEQFPRAVIAFRGYFNGNMIDECAFEVLYDTPEEMNTTLVSWCYATYNASTFDYYSQAMAYTMCVLQSYAPSSVLLSGTSMGGMVADLTAAGMLTHHAIALPVVAFLNMGRRRTMVALGLSLEGHNTSLVGAANQWDPAIRLDWDNRIGTICLFPTEEPTVCSACYAAAAGHTSNSSMPLASHHDQSINPSLQRDLSEACQECWSLTHDALLLLRLMQEGRNPTCYLMEDSVHLPVALAIS